MAAVGSVVVATAITAAEAAHWRAARSCSARPGPARAEPETIIVLGYPSMAGGRLHPLQRWRTDIAVRSMTPGCRTRHIFSGGAHDAGPTEAQVMAGYAQARLGGAPCEIVLETRARSTVENIERSLPLLPETGAIMIASDPLHAARGRGHLVAARPDLVSRLHAAQDYRLLERPLLKLGTAVGEGWLALHRRRVRLRARRECGARSEPVRHSVADVRRTQPGAGSGWLLGAVGQLRQHGALHLLRRLR